MKKSLVCVLSLLAPVAAVAASITPTVVKTAGTDYKTSAISGFSTSSGKMVGSQVVVNFLNNTTATGVWTAAGVTGTGWSLSLAGDSFAGVWTFKDTGPLAIKGFSFDGAPGNTTFDTIDTPDDTPGSASGNPFSDVTGPAGLAVTATYTNRLLVGGVFYGDEYTKLIVSLGGNGLSSGQNLTFMADTDNAMESSPIVIAATPEPSSLVLLGTGLLGLAGMARRRFSKV